MAKKILVIDDEKDILSVLGSRLKASGYEVFTASNGSEGMEILKKNLPNMILLDIVMPVMDGFEFFKALRKDTQKEDIPVLILTARKGMKDMFEALGVDEVIVKPFESAELLSKISAVFTDKILLLSDDTFVTEKVTEALSKYDYMVDIVKEEAEMTKKGRAGRYKAVIAHLPLVSKEPAEFTAALKTFRQKNPKVILYSDARVKGTEHNNSIAIQDVQKKWAKAGLNNFFDSRIAIKTFPELINSVID